MTTATKTRKTSKPGNVYMSTWTNGLGWNVTDTLSRVSGEILKAEGGLNVRIDRQGKPWKYLKVSETTNPHSAWELCLQIGQRYED